MKFELYKDVVLTHDVPEERLKRGDIVMEPANALGEKVRRPKRFVLSRVDAVRASTNEPQRREERGDRPFAATRS